MRSAIAIRQASAWVLALAMPATAAAQTLFFENFQTDVDPISGEPKLRCSGPGGPGTYTFPSGWLLRNVDNRTPNAQTSYVNDAWEVREDFGDNVGNCVAFSTSYYEPVGVADDWMWTPQIGPLPAGTTELSWRARAYDPAYPDGYEVRVMVAPSVPTGGTGVLGNQIASSTVVFSTAAEAASWTEHRVNLSAYAGQSLRVGFRNPSNDKFLLVVDDVKVERIVPADPELMSLAEVPPTVYSRVPAYFGLSAALEAVVRNSGSNALTGVTVDTDLLLDGQPAGSFSSTPIASMAPGVSQTVNAGLADYSQTGLWTFEALVRANEGDEIPANSVQAGRLIDVTENVLSRAEGPPVGVLGIGAGTGGEIGTDVEIPVVSRLYGVRVGFQNPDADPDGEPLPDGVGDFNGVELTVLVRAWDTNTDTPGALIAQDSTVVPMDAPVGPIALDFDFGRFPLPPGRYLIAMQEPIGRTIAVQMMAERFADNTTWVIWPASGGWQNFEDFGTQFERAADITAIVQPPMPVPAPQDDSFFVPQQGSFGADVSGNDLASDEGGSEWSVVTPPASGSVTMQVDGTFQFVPAAGSAGSTVSFVYRMCDADGDCADANVELNIEINTPTAQDDTFAVVSNEPFFGNVSTNDTPSGDGDNVWSVVVPPTAGLLLMQPSGAFSYTPVAAAAGTTVSFTYRLCDVDQDCSQATVDLQVGVNEPVAQDDDFTIPPTGTFEGDVTLNDTLSDDGADVVAVVTPPASGTLTMQTTGAFAYTPDAGAVGTTVTFAYSLCDEDQDCDTAQVQLSVSPFAIFSDSFE